MYTDEERRELVKMISEKRKEGSTWRDIAKLLDYANGVSALNTFHYHCLHIGVPCKKVGRPRKMSA